MENDVDTEVLTLSPSLKIIWDQINTETGIWDQINTKMGRTQAGILDQKLARLKNSADVHSANFTNFVPIPIRPLDTYTNSSGYNLGIVELFLSDKLNVSYLESNGFFSFDQTKV